MIVIIQLDMAVLVDSIILFQLVPARIFNWMYTKKYDIAYTFFRFYLLRCVYTIVACFYYKFYFGDNCLCNFSTLGTACP